MTNLNEITYVDWQLKLNSIGGVAEGADDINQCIAIILLTKKGSVPPLVRTYINTLITP